MTDAEKLEALGLRLVAEPFGKDGHHSDVPFTPEDNTTGDALAYYMGTLFADVQGENSPYWYHVRTSCDEWRRVARALRVHGLKIANAEKSEVS